MARRDALLRLHKSLVARKDDLRRRLGLGLEDLRNFKAADSTGDSADAAFDTGSEELASQLAELEARELSQIERALLRMKQGSYGLCEGCQIKIPVARLNALPYSTLCIKCQREMETGGDWEHGRGGQDWGKVSESDSFDRESKVDLSDIEMDISK
jgi:DnaK suppressor protein